jgi:invasion protein IalB
MLLTRKLLSRSRLWTLTAALSVLVAGAAVPVRAQDAAAPAEPGAAAPLPTPQSNVAPQPEWEKVCGPVNDQQECHISRRRVAATGQALAQFMIIERGDKKLIQVAVPPVALIQPGIQIKIDQGQPTGVKYVVCTPGECLALGEINAEFIASLKGGGNLIITMLNPQGKPVNFDIGLNGFTATYDGPGLNPQEAQARQQRLEDELKKKADAARQQLLDAQQQSTSTQ